MGKWRAWMFAVWIVWKTRPQFLWKTAYLAAWCVDSVENLSTTNVENQKHL